jgi:hypothetical protein
MSKQDNRTSKARPRRTDNALHMINSAFRRTITITDNGRKRKVTVIEAIVLQLLAAEARGNRRAASIRLKYQNLERSPLPAPRIVVTREEVRPTPPKRKSGTRGDDE